MALPNWKGRPYRPVGGTGYIRVYKPDINELMKPLSQKSGLGSAILTGNIINPQNSPAPLNVTPTPTASITPSVTPTISLTPSVTNTNTPSVTPSNTNTPSITPSVTPTEPYDVYLFEECGNPSNKFRYENVPGLLTLGNVYLITGGTSSLVWDTTTSQWVNETSNWDSATGNFTGYATVISYSAVGPLYSGTGISFTQQPNCPGITPTPTITSTITPTPSITATITNTQTPSVTPTQTITQTITQTVTNTQTSSPTPSSTPPPFSPSGLTNLQLWFMSTSGASVSSWTNYGLLGGSVSQGNASFQPTILSSSLGSYTGSSVQFVGRDFMSGTFASTNYTASTVFSVIKINATDANGWTITLYGTGSNNTSWEWQSRNTSTTSIVRKRPGSSISPVRTIQPLLLASSGLTGSFLTASFNDAIGSSGTTTYTGVTATNFNFGFDPGTSSSTNIEIFEQLVYNRVLTTTEYGNVMNYLKTKYQYSTW